jgi:hypothetical protein
MRLTFHGAAQTVTGSRHLVTLNGHQLLLDCGLFQGPRKETAARNFEFGFDPAAVGGEAEPAAALQAGLQDLGFDDVRYPARGDFLEL